MTLTTRLVAGLGYAFLAAVANAADGSTNLCSLIPVANIEALLGSKVAASTPREGIVESTCSYRTVPGENGPGFLFLGLYKVPMQTDESGLMMMPGDKLTPLPGVGDEAVMNANTNELKFRSGARWFHITSRGAPCPGDKIGADRAIKEACDVKRNDLLSAVAKLVIAAAK